MLVTVCSALCGYDPNWIPRTPVLAVPEVFDRPPRVRRPKLIAKDTRYGKYRTISYFSSSSRWKCLDTDGLISYKKARELIAARDQKST